jgi:hypothetical protein
VSNTPAFPAPYRLNGRLVWDRHEVENHKRSLMGLDLIERDPNATIVFVSAAQLTAELPYGRRTLGRRVQGREQGAPATVTVATAEKKDPPGKGGPGRR